jgi:hypothetical protein
LSEPSSHDGTPTPSTSFVYNLAAIKYSGAQICGSDGM